VRDQGEGRGQVTITYRNLEQLDWIFTKLKA
jgi:hypothetical protein